MTHPNYFASADGQPARTRAGRCPLLPVARSAASRRWGLLICYEGLYPYVSGHFAQMEGLVAQGATSFVWSVGGLFPVGAYSDALGKRFGVDVVCASGGANGCAARDNWSEWDDGRDLGGTRQAILCSTDLALWKRVNHKIP